MIEQLPLGKYVIGDNAYVCTEHILTPFPGSQRDKPKNNAYNFYLSQLRIQIEMTFGLFVNKWRIFKCTLQVKLKKCWKSFLCATRLHNFCINQAEDDSNTPSSNVTSNDATETDFGFIPSDIGTTSIEGNSIIRKYMVDKIAGLGLSQLAHNLPRNRNNSCNIIYNIIETTSSV